MITADFEKFETFKFEKINDSISGRLVKIEDRFWEQGNKTIKSVVLETTTGIVKIPAYTNLLKILEQNKQLFNKNIEITFLQNIDTSKDNPMKKFGIEILN